MDNKIFKERNGGRMFERVSRWGVIDYTIVTKRNRFAKYGDDFDGKKDKYNLTYFELRKHMYPVNMFEKLAKCIELEDHSLLSRQSVENNQYFLEISPKKDKVRLYKEITV